MYSYKVSGIAKSYGKKAVLKNMDFSICPGECIGIVGNNGCGKSTFLRILAGTLKADACALKEAAEGLIIGYVPQENPLFENLSVLDNLKFWYCDTESSINEDLNNGVLKTFKLDTVLKSKVKKLSGGMKKRLSIACALAKRPTLLILDEPGASLDLLCKEDIRNYIKEYVKAGNSVVMASHEETELSVCSRLYLMEDGLLKELPCPISVAELQKRMLSHE